MGAVDGNVAGTTSTARGMFNSTLYDGIQCESCHVHAITHSTAPSFQSIDVMAVTAAMFSAVLTTYSSNTRPNAECLSNHLVTPLRLA